MKKKKRLRILEEGFRPVKPTVSKYRGGDYRLVSVFVEGYDDVSFWRGIFDDYETEKLKFEICVPPREDLAKGKKVLMQMIPQSNPNLLLCVDSDFDYLFDGANEQSHLVNSSPYVFHTYAYSAENFLCYAPSLHNVCVKSTKNDTVIFDFELFLKRYSEIIYPLFLWYAFTAKRKSEKIFTLIEFKSSIRLNYLDINNDGVETLNWLERQVAKRIHYLEHDNPDWISQVRNFGTQIKHFGVEPENVYMFMQGHALMDNVVMTMLHEVCERLRELVLQKISQGTKQGVALKNEMSNYNNSLRNVREVLLDNENYKNCDLYQKLKTDIERYINNLGLHKA